MSAFQKLFLATAILATGLAVAVLLGQPVISKTAPGLIVPSALPPVALSPPLTTIIATDAVSSVRLLPDADAPSKTTNLLDAPALLPPLAPISVFTSAALGPPAAQLAALSNAAPPRSFDSGAPFVHLRNEAPRPIGNEPRTTPTIRRAPPVDVQTDPPLTNSATRQDASIWATPPTGFSDGANYAGNTPATPAAFTNSVPTDSSWQPSLPPRPAAEDAEDSQTHIVADGDSLEKLAALYLRDPHRGKEIFELNRDVLADPNLLPIGAELKIPDRIAGSFSDRQSRRPGFQGDSNVREAAMGDLIPIRSLSGANSGAVPPQAQLTRPVAVD